MGVDKIAQLIKLQDYISRYERDAFRYPSQYIRLKKENWKKLHYLWINSNNDMEKHQESKEETSTFSKWKSFIKRESQFKEEDVVNPLPNTESELKHYFLDKLFPFQLKWATSTVKNLSFTDKGYYHDETLKYFLQRFPDIYLVMYYPIFNIKKAPIDGEIIFISPIGIEIIYLMEKNPKTTIMAGNERIWTIETGNIQLKEISPLIALKRSEQIVKSILNASEIEFPVKKTVISRTNNIVFSSEPYNTSIVGKREYEKWFHEKRQLNSSLKSIQLKVIEALLKHCQSTSIKRPEWEEETNTFEFDKEE